MTFKQVDMDKIVEMADHRGAAATCFPMTAAYGHSILNLCVSDLNKRLLLNCNGFLPLLVDSLLLDPRHPRVDNNTLLGKTDWEATKAPVQRVSTSRLVASRSPCLRHL